MSRCLSNARRYSRVFLRGPFHSAAVANCGQCMQSRRLHHPSLLPSPPPLICSSSTPFLNRLPSPNWPPHALRSPHDCAISRAVCPPHAKTGRGMTDGRRTRLNLDLPLGQEGRGSKALQTELVLVVALTRPSPVRPR